MEVKDRKNLADAGKFALIYTVLTTLLIIIIIALCMSFISSIPIIGGIIGGVAIVSAIVLIIVHIIIAALIHSYFALYDTGHRRLGYGYYAQRKGVGSHRRNRLDRNLGARVGLFFLHLFIVSSVTSLVSGILGNIFLGFISIFLNAIMMLLQRVIYTPERARRLR